ncbi:MAG: DUF2785 domain-containing protein [Betaproteobacteria bacterium]|nr:DUF2785 domain-containing protein [Betaproteobacteria bacterium]
MRLTDRWYRRALAALALMLPLAAGATPSDAASRTAFWRAVVADQHRIPAGVPIVPLIDELVGMSASRDPVVRDDLGYEVFARWIHRGTGFEATHMAAWQARLTAQAREGLGTVDPARAPNRAFALLFLKELVFAGQRVPYLDAAQATSLVQLVVDSLQQEQDRRGYDREAGWVHALAHAADLARALGRSARVDDAQRKRLIEALAARVDQESQAFQWGEETRIATALASLASAGAKDALRAWAGRVAARCEAVWRAAPFETSTYRAARMAVPVLHALVALDGARNVRLDAETLEVIRKAALQCQ